MTRKYLLDLTERVVVTFAGAFLAAVTVPDLIDWDVSALRAAALAGGAAVLSLVKGMLATYTGDRDSASLLR